MIAAARIEVSHALLQWCEMSLFDTLGQTNLTSNVHSGFFSLLDAAGEKIIENLVVKSKPFITH
jgi:hypothetical protein